MAVPVVGIAPSRKAGSTNARVSSGLSPSSAMICVELRVALGLDEAAPLLVDVASDRHAVDEVQMRSFLLRRVGLESTARRIFASVSISLSLPSPRSSRYFSTSMRM